jgi:hypothetical protein
MLGSSLPPVVCRRADVLFILFDIVVSNMPWLYELEGSPVLGDHNTGIKKYSSIVPVLLN